MNGAWLMLHQVVRRIRKANEPPAEELIVPLPDFSQTVLAVDWQRVNLEDLLAQRPAGIIRCMGDPREVVFPMPRFFAGREAVEGDI